MISGPSGMFSALLTCLLLSTATTTITAVSCYVGELIVPDIRQNIPPAATPGCAFCLSGIALFAGSIYGVNLTISQYLCEGDAATPGITCTQAGAALLTHAQNYAAQLSATLEPIAGSCCFTDLCNDPELTIYYSPPPTPPPSVPPTPSERIPALPGQSITPPIKRHHKSPPPPRKKAVPCPTQKAPSTATHKGARSIRK